MIKLLLKFGLTHRTLVLIGSILVLAVGLLSYTKVHLEAFPDPTPIIIDVSAQAAGLSAEQMETYYTIPLETAVFPIAHVEKIRSTSFQGLSWIQITFRPEADYYTAYNLTAVALQQMPALLNNITPIIQQSSPLGEVVQYEVKGPKDLGLTNLRTLQDWVIARRLFDVEVRHSVGQQNLDIRIDRNKASRYGLNTGDITGVIQSALAGHVASIMYEGDRLFDIVVRLDKKDRETIDKISNLPVSYMPSGSSDVAYVPLKEISDINLTTGSSFIYRDSGRRHIAVRFSVRNRDLESAVNEIKSRIATNVKFSDSITAVRLGTE